MSPIPTGRPGRARGQPHAGLHPFRVDLLPPPEGFDGAIEADIMRFLDRRAGAFVVWGPIATGGDFLRYCFALRIDAEAFQLQFAPAAEKAVFREVFPRLEKI
jgi:hypothetical protein